MLRKENESERGQTCICSESQKSTVPDGAFYTRDTKTVTKGNKLTEVEGAYLREARKMLRMEKEGGTSYQTPGVAP